MTVNKVKEIVDRIIANTLEEYDQSPISQGVANTGAITRIPHALDIVDADDIYFAMDMALKSTALKATPIDLLESQGSTAQEFKRISEKYFIRVPNDPVAGQNLDIDDGLAYAVVFKTLGEIWREYNEYMQRGDIIINTHEQSYRKYLENLLAGGAIGIVSTYIKFSSDNLNWHDNYQAGDMYISFKRIDTDTWTNGALFVGQNGTNGTNGLNGTNGTNFDDTLNYVGNAGKVIAVNATENGIELVTPSVGGSGGGVSTFIALSDTPITLTANKYLKVNTAGNALEFVDAPISSGGGGLAGANPFGDKVFYNDSANGTLEIDAETNNVFYLYPNGNTVLSFKQFDDGGQVDAFWGTTYTFMLVSLNSMSISFNPAITIQGDHAIELGNASTGNSTTLTTLKMIYDGFNWVVISKTITLDYQA